MVNSVEMTLSDLLENPLYLIAAIACIVLIGFIFIIRGRRYPYHACETLLTPCELKFYTILKQAIPANTAICMKVRMADIINCEERDWQAGWGPKISAKHIDFVLIDANTTAVKLAIELDDSTHSTHQDRIERDKFVNKAFDIAGVPLLRIPVEKFYDFNKLKKKINLAIGWDPQQI